MATAFTNIPWKLYNWLAVPGENAGDAPSVIVMMGGGGIPSESGLTRAWKTAEVAALFPDALVVVAMPLEYSESDQRGIEYELRMREVSPERILRESKGRNTREQAVETFKLLDSRWNMEKTVIGLVTSPEHMRRTWGSFKKAGFVSLNAYPSWPQAITADLQYGDSKRGGPSIVGAVGASMTLRYRVWDNLGIILDCSREVTALIYYKILGWI